MSENGSAVGTAPLMAGQETPPAIGNAEGARDYCKRPMNCVAGTRGPCRVCHGNETAILRYHGGGKRKLIETARHFGVTKQRVAQILDRAGVFSRFQPHKRADR